MRSFSHAQARYDGVSRFLHWLMAVGFGVMLVTILARRFADETPLSDALWPWHRLIGFTLFLVWWIRVLWAWRMREESPAAISTLALWGHRLLYVFMLVVPCMALFRQYGSGRAFTYFGIPITQASDNKVEWMVSLGNNWHGNLGIVLFIAIFLHIMLAYWHRRNPATDVLGRM